MADELVGRGTYELRVDDTKFRRGLDSADSEARQLSATFKKQTSLIQGMFAGLGIGIFNQVSSLIGRASGFVKDSMFGLNASLEQVSIGFTTMLGSGKAAQKMIEDLQHFAATTPFDFPGLQRSTQRLLAFGFAGDQIIPTLSSIGDAVAALGGSTYEIDRVTNAIGQMFAKGRVQNEELLQLAEIGIPVYTLLAEKLGVTTGEVQDLVSAGKVSPDDFLEGFKDFTDRNYGGLMAKQANTAEGAWSNIVDTLQMAIADGFKPLFDVVRNGMIGLADFLGGDTFTAWTEGFADGMETAFDWAGRFFRLIGGPLWFAFIALRDGVITFKQALSGDWTNNDQIRTFHRIIGEVGLFVRNFMIPAFDLFGRIAVPVFETLSEVVGFVTEHLTDFFLLFAPLAVVAWRFFRAIGEHGVVGALRELPDILGDVIDEAVDLRRALVTGLLDFIKKTDWQDVFEDVVDAISGLLNRVDWRGMINNARDSISDEIGDVDWSEVFSDAGAGISAGFRSAFAFGSSIVGWVADEVSDIDWSEVAGTVGGGILSGVEAITDAGIRIKDWIGGQLDKVDWTETGKAVGGGIWDAVTATVDAGARFAGWVYAGVTDIDWTDTATSIGGGIWDAITTTVDAGASLYGWISDKVPDIDWKDTGKSVASGIWGSVTDAFDLGKRFYSWIDDTVDDIDWADTGESIGDGIWGAITDAVDLGSEIADWIQDQLDKVDWSGHARSISSGILDAIHQIHGTGQDIVNWIRDDLRTADYSGIAQQLNTGIRGAIETTQSAGIFQALFGADSGLMEFVDQHITPAITAIGQALGPRIIPLLVPFRDAWREIVEFLRVEVGPTLSGFSRILENLSTIVSTLVPGTAEGLGGLSAALRPLGQALLFVVSPFLLAQGALYAFIGPALPGLVQAATGAFQILTGALGLVTGAISGFVRITKAIATGDWGEAWNALTETVRGFREDLELIGRGIYNEIVGWFRSIVEGVRDGLGTLDQILTGGKITEAIKTFTGFFSGLPGEIVGYFTGMVQSVGETVGGWASSIRTKAEEVKSNVVTPITNMVTEAIGQFVDLVKTGPSEMGKLVTAVVEKARSLYSQVTNKVSELADSVVRTMAGLPGRVLTALGDLTTFLWNAGVDLVQGFIDGIIYAAPGVLSAIKENILDLLPGFIADRLDSHSPSRVMIPIGYTVPQGLAVGIMNGAPLVRTALAGTADVIKDETENGTAADSAVSSAASFGLRILNAISSAMSGVDADALEGVKSIGDALKSGISALLDVFDFTAKIRDFDPSAISDDFQGKLQWLIDLGTMVASEVAFAAQNWGDEVNPKLEAFESDMSSSFSALGSIVENVLKINEFDPSVISDRFEGKLQWLIDLGTLVASELGAATQNWNAEVNPQIDAFEQDAQSSFSTLTSALDFILAADSFNPDRVRGNIGRIVDYLVSIGRMAAGAVRSATRHFVGELDPAIAAFQADTSNSFGALGSALDFVTSVDELKPEMLERNFGVLLDTLINIGTMAKRAIAYATRNWSAEVDPEIAAWSEDVQNSFGGITGIVDGILALAGITPQDVSGFSMRLAQGLINIGTSVTLAVQQAAANWASTANPQIAAFVADVGATMELFGQAGDFIVAMSDMRSSPMMAPPQWPAIMERFKAVIRLVIQTIIEIAQEFSAKALEPAAKFAEMVGGVFTVMGQAVQLFNAIAEMSKLTKRHVDVFKSNWELIIQLVIDLAEITSDEGVAAAIRFERAAKTIAAALKAGADAISTVAGGGGSSFSGAGSGFSSIGNILRTSSTAGGSSAAFQYNPSGNYAASLTNPVFARVATDWGKTGLANAALGAEKYGSAYKWAEYVERVATALTDQDVREVAGSGTMGSAKYSLGPRLMRLALGAIQWAPEQVLAVLRGRGYATGGYITTDQLALLHANEHIVPDRSIPMLAQQIIAAINDPNSAASSSAGAMALAGALLGQSFGEAAAGGTPPPSDFFNDSTSGRYLADQFSSLTARYDELTNSVFFGAGSYLNSGIDVSWLNSKTLGDMSPEEMYAKFATIPGFSNYIPTLKDFQFLWADRDYRRFLMGAMADATLSGTEMQALPYAKFEGGALTPELWQEYLAYSAEIAKYWERMSPLYKSLDPAAQQQRLKELEERIMGTPQPEAPAPTPAMPPYQPPKAPEPIGPIVMRTPSAHEALGGGDAFESEGSLNGATFILNVEDTSPLSATLFAKSVSEQIAARAR